MELTCTCGQLDATVGLSGVKRRILGVRDPECPAHTSVWLTAHPVTGEVDWASAAKWAREAWRSGALDAGLEPAEEPTIERRDPIYPGELVEQYGESAAYVLIVRGRVGVRLDHAADQRGDSGSGSQGATVDHPTLDR